jgi:hypothetical protein
MSYFDDASLVMIPSGYKDQKVYSVKPLDGSGDLTFSRASSATRVASNGLIEKVRTNIALYSEQFDNAAWTKLQATVTANATTSPIGTTTADRIVPSAVLAFHNVTNSPLLSDGVLYSLSVYAKADGYNFVAVGNGFGTRQAAFNLSTGVVSSVTSNTTASIVSVGSGWYRCSISFVTTGSSNQLQITVDNGTETQFVGDGTSGIFLWGAQTETGDIATDYIATTTAAVSVGPVSGLPRLDYLNSSCPRLLLEPQRSNLALYSEQFDNASWLKYQATASANVAAAPDGTTSADLLLDTAFNDAHAFYRSVSGSAGTYTWSVFAKAQNNNFLIISAFTGAHNRTWFNLSNGTVGTNTSGNTAKIENYGNGWYRVSVSREYVSGPLIYEVSTSKTNGVSAYLGNGSDGIYLWGAQMEAGAYATSYIPTLGTSVTRVADEASKTGISSLIGQTEGTLFVEMNNVNELDIPEITLDDNTNNNRIVLTRDAVNGFWAIFTASAGLGASTIGTTAGNSGKFALAYSSAGYVLYRNGVQIVTRTAALPVSLSAVRLNGRATSDFFGNKNVSQAILFPTRLSNSDLAALTA